MTVFLSLLTAAIFGTGDFFGGLAAKRAAILQVVAGSHFVGLIGVLFTALLIAEEFSMRALLLGAAGGVFGGLGVGLLYRRLAVGPMAVVAPITAITSAAVPALWAVLTGDSLSGLAWAGVAVALLAIGLVSYSDDGTSADVSASVVAESLLAGVGFGTFFIFLDATESVHAPWPVVGARVATSASLILFLFAKRREFVPRTKVAAGLIAATGVLDTVSNVIFLYAANRGSLTIVAVLSSLYPISTVVLARLVLAERMTRAQLAGFVAALVATGLIAAG